MSSKAFIFGSNYRNTSAALKACVRDCQRMSESLKARGYEIIQKWSEDPLVKSQIHNDLKQFLKSLKPGDKAIVYYSGHGFQIPDISGDEPDGKDECIYLGASYISDDEFRLLLQTVPAGINILCVFDCCHSGTILDLPLQYEQLKVRRENNFHFKANILCISGCADPNVSFEANGTGYLTDCFIKTLQDWKPILSTKLPWADFYLRISSRLIEHSNAKQFAQLSLSQPNVLRTFWL